MFLLALGAAVADWRRPGPAPELDAAPDEVLLVSGCIAEPVIADGVQSRFVVELEPGARVRATLTSRPGERLPALAYGQRVGFEAKVRKPRNFANPGAFDYVGYLARQGVYWTASVRGAGQVRVLPGDCGAPARRFALAVRAWFTARVRELYRGDDYVQRLMPALLTGDNGNLDRSSTDEYRRTGTYHALVVSGLHIAVVAGSVLALLRTLGVPFGFTLCMAAGFAWFYAAVVDWQPPVVRSAAGFTLFLVARWFFRRGSVLNLLAVVAFVLLTIDPLAVFDPGFQLTFLSVAAIGGIATPLTDRTFGPYRDGVRLLHQPSGDPAAPDRVAEWRIEMRLLAETLRIPVRALAVLLGAVFWIAESVVISASVQASLVLPMVAYFHTFSATGILANLTVVLPLTVAVPLGLLACVTGFPPFVWAAGALVHAAHWLTALWDSFEPGLRIPDPPFAVAVAAGLLLALGGLVLLRCRWRGAVPAGAAAVLAGTLLVALHPFPVTLSGDFELTGIDVGQGDSLLVVSREGRTLLVDSGGSPSFDPRIQPRLDIGEDVVSPFLWRLGLSRLDAVAISHFHEDHSGGMARVIRNFRPRELWVGATPQSASWNAVREAAAASGTRVFRLVEGQQRDLGSAKVSVLAPAADYVPAATPRNHDSLVLLVENGRHRFLLSGDAEETVETGLLRRQLPEIDVLKVAHHGSRTSTSPEFLGAARPLFGFISAGAENFYGHPNPETLDRLLASGVRVFRSDKDGMVSFRSDGHTLKLFLSKYR